MTVAKVHHYVPRFYLERFVDPDGFVWVYDKAMGRTFKGRPKTLARESYFNEVPFFRDTGIDPQYVEQQLAELESEAANITACWFRQIEQGSKVVIPEVNRAIMSEFIATQIFRTPEQRLIISQALRVADEDELKNLHTRLAQNWVDEARNAIKGFIWVFGKNDSGIPFYTSDHPVSIVSHPRGGQRQCLHAFQFPAPAVEISLPLSPTLMFYAYDRVRWAQLEPFDGCASPVIFTPELVQADNYPRIGHSRRFVYCDRDEFAFARAFCAEHPQIADIDRVRFVK
jgi:hypothetical protein